MLKPDEVLAIVPQLVALVPDVREIRITTAANGRWSLYCDIGGQNFQVDDAASFHKLLNFATEKVLAVATA
jgi:hypothetical protein